MRRARDPEAPDQEPSVVPGVSSLPERGRRWLGGFVQKQGREP